MLRLIILFLISLSYLSPIFGQMAPPELEANTSSNSQIFIKKSTDAIVVDGRLEESAWFEGIEASQFTQYFPLDTVLAQGDTEIYL
ncbi:MAG: hypothetical protein AB8G22_13580, partial [Saprospiraceae bacterium]